MVRRSVDIDHQFCPRAGSFTGVVFGPQVLTHAQRNLEVRGFNQVQLFPLAEIAFFVEYAVIRQVSFMVGGDYFPVPDETAGIKKACSSRRRVADDDVDALRLVHDALQGLFHLHVEMGTQQQVFRRVAGQDQFREYNGICAGSVPGPGNIFKYQFRISANITDTWINLGNSNSLHNIWGQSKNTVRLAAGADLSPSIFTLTPNILLTLIARQQPHPVQQVTGPLSHRQHRVRRICPRRCLCRPR